MPDDDHLVVQPGDPVSDPWPGYGVEDERAAAIRSLRRKRDFWGHCNAYLIVNGLIVIVWLVIASTTGLWFFWPIFPLAGWGIGLAFHAVATFGRASRPITETDIRNEMQHLERH